MCWPMQPVVLSQEWRLVVWCRLIATLALWGSIRYLALRLLTLSQFISQNRQLLTYKNHNIHFLLLLIQYTQNNFSILLIKLQLMKSTKRRLHLNWEVKFVKLSCIMEPMFSTVVQTTNRTLKFKNSLSLAQELLEWALSQRHLLPECWVCMCMEWAW